MSWILLLTFVGLLFWIAMRNQVHSTRRILEDIGASIVEEEIQLIDYSMNLSGAKFTSPSCIAMHTLLLAQIAYFRDVFGVIGQFGTKNYEDTISLLARLSSSKDFNWIAYVNEVVTALREKRQSASEYEAKEFEDLVELLIKSSHVVKGVQDKIRIELRKVGIHNED